jgi:hypothetical protein
MLTTNIRKRGVIKKCLPALTRVFNFLFNSLNKTYSPATHSNASGEGALTQHYVQLLGRVNPGHKKKSPRKSRTF